VDHEAASWLSRRLQIDRLGYRHSEDVDQVRRGVVRFLDRGGKILGGDDKCARIALDELADVPDSETTVHPLRNRTV
jgi:hypothetical protein